MNGERTTIAWIMTFTLSREPMFAKEGSQKIQEDENYVFEEKETHLSAECRCFLMESSWDKWWLGDPDPPRKTPSPGRSSGGPTKDVLLSIF